MSNIFIPVVGQFTNIGDVLHRRELLSWLKNAGTLHIYVGNAPDSFIEGLRLDNKVVIYKSLIKWLIKLSFSGFNKTNFVFNPGEIRLGSRRLKGEILLFPFQCLVRLKNGKVLRVGIAAMSNSSSKNIWLWKLLFMPTSQVYWRTNHSRDLFGIGEVIPDLAFYDISNDLLENNVSREYLTISMRGDRPFPTDSWFKAVKNFATDYSLKIKVVAQVRMDNARTVEIASKLNADELIWPDKYTHSVQEEALCMIYEKTKLILSDRLHVLILAFSKGAIPANILPKLSEKVQHHFDVLGMENISILDSGYEDVLYEFLKEKYLDSQVLINLPKAKEKLDLCRNEIIRGLKKN
ncbi:polysaccharide pyruvyl transferase family protein [Flavobacterium alkalisoli]|uniref:polysaccharide pyruvyl transferase family protein n=1 Tax=Flavobacterium alkalisoli TaxID=2602769 RepID=UPI003A8DAAA9